MWLSPGGPLRPKKGLMEVPVAPSMIESCNLPRWRHMQRQIPSPPINVAYFGSLDFSNLTSKVCNTFAALGATFYFENSGRAKRPRNVQRPPVILLHLIPQSQRRFLEASISNFILWSCYTVPFPIKQEKCTPKWTPKVNDNKGCTTRYQVIQPKVN